MPQRCRQLRNSPGSGSNNSTPRGRAVPSLGGAVSSPLIRVEEEAQWEREATILKSSLADRNTSPRSDRLTSSMVGRGRWDRLAMVLCLILPPSR